MREGYIWCMQLLAALDVSSAETSDISALRVHTRNRCGERGRIRGWVANKSADLVDAPQDEVVQLAEVSDANSDVALMAVDTENNDDVANVVPTSSVNDLVSVVNTDEVASTSGTKQLESANDGNEEISYLGVLNNEDVEEELSDDTESQVSMCENDGSSQGLAFNASQVDFSGGFTKIPCIVWNKSTVFWMKTYGKQININDFFP